ncbi:OprD family porin [Pseudomonas sp. App30]|uniref:OprD family porin n=1 Tax=Pseudomonas sp. App30 TaxID=3068990 RepID=UPI003A80ADE9
MYKSSLALAVAVGVFAAHAGAEGFIDDSKAVLKLRNYYINTDNRDSGTKAAGAANYQAEWGQGFQLEFQSGYTEGTVGFGVDAIGLLGVRLDSSRAKSGNTSGVADGGTVFPTDGNDPASEFSSLGLTAKAKISKTELKLGTLMPKLPVIQYNDGRLLPQTFQGGQVTSNEIKDLTLIAGQIDTAKGRNSSNNENLSISGSNGSGNSNATGLNARSNKFYYAGADYKVTKDLLVQYYYGELTDFYQQHFLGLVHNWAIGPGVLKSDLRVFHSTDDGVSATDTDHFSSGDYRGVASGRGPVDNNLYSGLFLYTVAGHTFGGGYQVSNGSSDFPWLNQGDGSSNYTITDMQIQKFGRAGERTWQGRYSYDFAALGLPGATAGIVYLRGDNIDTVGSNRAVSGTGRSEWERDITLAYVVPTGTLKGLGFTWKNAMWRNDIPGQRDQDENRVIVSYSIPLL